MEVTEKMNFFKRIKNAIFKLENYGVFLGERFKVAFHYFLLLILLITFVVAMFETYFFGKMINKGYQYIENELPNFSYQDGIIDFEERCYAYDDEFKLHLFIDSDINISDETIQDYKTKAYDGEKGLIILYDKLIYISSGTETEYDYDDVLTFYQIELTSKQDLIDQYNSIGLFSICLMFFFAIFLGMYLSNSIVIISDLALVAVFGYLASRICRVKIKILPMISLSIYAMTLSIILSGVYSVVYLLTGFVISYFNIMYLLIGYVYIIAAILMIKSDLIRYNLELAKIVEVQKQVKEEMSEEEKPKDKEKENKKEEKNKEDKEPEINAEPDGSEI